MRHRVLADLPVKRGRARTELGHLAENGDPAASARALGEVGQRRAHRDRVGVVGVVDEQAAARKRDLLTAPP